MSVDLTEVIRESLDPWECLLTERVTAAVRDHLADAFDAEAKKWLLPSCPCASCKAVAFALGNLRATLGIPKSSVAVSSVAPAAGMAQRPHDAAAHREGAGNPPVGSLPVPPDQTKETT